MEANSNQTEPNLARNKFMSAQTIILQIIKETSLIDQRMNDQFIARVEVLAQSNPNWTSLERDFFPTSFSGELLV